MDNLYINDVEIPVYPNDTDATLVERIAASVNTTPEMLWIEGAGHVVPRMGKFYAHDVYTLARGQRFSDLKSMEDYFREWIEKSSVTGRTSSESELRLPHLHRAFIENLVGSSLPTRYIYTITNLPDEQVDEYIESAERYRADHETRLRETILSAKRTTEAIKRAEREGIVSDIVIEGTKALYELHTTRHLPLTALHDSIVCVRAGEEGVQFSRIGRIIKFHQATTQNAVARVHTPDEDEDNLDRCVLIVGITLKPDVVRRAVTVFKFRYATHVGSDKNKSRVSLTVEHTYRNGDPDLMSMMHKYLPLLNEVCHSVTRTESVNIAAQVKPRFTFITEIMQHVLFFERIGREFALDERHNSSRGRVMVFHLATKIKMSLAVERGNAYTSGDFTRIRYYDVTTPDFLSRASSDVMELLNTYRDTEANHVATYERCLPVGDSLSGPRVLRNTMRNRAERRAVMPYLEQAAEMPELFVSYYTRSCSKDRLPKIIASEAEANGKPVHVFPKATTGSTEPALMTCPSAEHPHFGLMNNTLGNKDQFEYIPCCYSKVTIRQPSMREYYEDVEKTARTAQRIYTTPRILPLQSYGTLPPGPTQFFNILGKPAANAQFHLVPEFINKQTKKPVRAVRCGVQRGPNAFIEAVRRAMEIQQHAHNMNRGNTTEAFIPQEINADMLIAERRRILAPRQNYPVPMCTAAQEVWDIDMATADRWASDPTLYFDPRRFARLVEEYYGINVYIFEKSARRVTGATSVYSSERGAAEVKLIISEQTHTPNGALIAPEHCPDGPYYHCKKPALTTPEQSWRNVYIYVHQGSDVDRGQEFPHIEYILSDNLGPAAVAAYRLFTRITLGTENVNTVDYEETLNNVYNKLGTTNLSQTLDRGGRCVAVLDQVLDTPIPPLPVQINARGRQDMARIDEPRNSLIGLRTLQRMARVLTAVLVKLRLENQGAPVPIVVSEEKYSWYTGSVMRRFQQGPVWRWEDARDIFTVDDALVVDSEDTKQRLEAATTAIIDNMTDAGRDEVLRQKHIDGYYHDLDDFEQRPGHVVTLVRLLNSAPDVAWERTIIFNTPAPVRDRQEVLMINDEGDNIVELRYKAVHGEGAMQELMNRGMGFFGKPSESVTLVWDGFKWREMRLSGYLPIRYICVYKVDKTPVFLVSMENGDERVDRIIRNY